MTLAIGLGIGSLSMGGRRFFLDRHLWIGAAVGILMQLPNILWQLDNGWPTSEFYRNVALLKNLPAKPHKTGLNE